MILVQVCIQNSFIGSVTVTPKFHLHQKQLIYFIIEAVLQMKWGKRENIDLQNGDNFKLSIR